MRSLRDLTINGAGEDFEKILTAVDNHTLLDYDGEFDLTRPNERTYCLRPRQGVKCIEADEEVASSFTASFPNVSRADFFLGDNVTPMDPLLQVYMFPKDEDPRGYFHSVGLRLGYLGQKRDESPLVTTLKSISKNPAFIACDFDARHREFLKNMLEYGDQVRFGTFGAAVRADEQSQGIVSFQVMPAPFFSFVEASTEKPAYAHLGQQDEPGLLVQLGGSVFIPFWTPGTNNYPNEPLTAYIKQRS